MAYPIFVKLDGRRCVVVGAGRVAERRIDPLLRQQAQVRVVAPQATSVIRGLAVNGKLSWMSAHYSSEHLEGAFLVVAATDDREINATVCRDAIERKLLVSCADRPDEGSFVTPAVVERGNLIIAISTDGKSPTFAAVVRERIEQQYGPEWSGWTELFGRLRSKMQQIPSESGRRHAVNAVLDNPIVSALVGEQDLRAAEREAERCISSPPA